MDYDGDGSQDNEHYTSVNAMSKEKRICHRHSPQQIQMLEAYFKECPHPNESQRQKFCNELNLEIDQVKFWFQNKRTQSKAQDERTSNILLRAENVTCPPCGGPPFGREEREPNLHKLRLENPLFKEEEKWKMLFPTIVNKAKTIHTLGSELPIKENCNVLQMIWEQLHILSPLVPPREFMIVRCCQQIGERLWIIADVSQHIVNSDQSISPSCYKRPSGCLIRSLPNPHTEVRWIEHVEVNHTADTHRLYRELVSDGSGYGARRWIVTLERMCERMALSTILIMPATDWSETIPTVEGRKSVMKLGERMVKIFNEMLIMSGKVEFPQQSKCGVRISIRMNMEPGQLPGLVVSAASCLSIPLTPLQVFNSLRSNDTRLKTMEMPLQGTSMHGGLRSQDKGDATTRDKHILISDENSKTRNVSENAADRVSRLISQTVQSIKVMLNCPPE
ncbi:hypothetical protein F2Q68_00007554 [Brassica cretica]|uniref:Homeobox domain-containing protein n=1 Tax=Brassica cretica TaxID=69181 RepID=A0A8S9KT63_BRACR|nr:hypothetical protein F2Q68_00007554 [Brassica cretica]